MQKLFKGFSMVLTIAILIGLLPIMGGVSITASATTNRTYYLNEDLTAYEGNSVKVNNAVPTWSLADISSGCTDPVTVTGGAVTLVKSNTTGPSNLRITKSLPPVSMVGKVTYEFQGNLNFTKTASGTAFYSGRFFKLYGGDINTNPIFDTWFWNGQLTINDKAATSNRLDYFIPTDGTWHIYKYVIDFDKGTYNVVVDGTTLTSSSGVSDLVFDKSVISTKNITDFEMQVVTDGGLPDPGTFAVKDFKIYKENPIVDDSSIEYFLNEDYTNYPQGADMRGQKGWAQNTWLGSPDGTNGSITADNGEIKITTKNIKGIDISVVKNIPTTPKSGTISYEFDAKYINPPSPYYSMRFMKLNNGARDVNPLFGDIWMGGGNVQLNNIQLASGNATTPVSHNYKYIINYDNDTFKIMIDGVMLVKNSISDFPLPATFKQTATTNTFEIQVAVGDNTGLESVADFSVWIANFKIYRTKASTTHRVYFKQDDLTSFANGTNADGKEGWWLGDGTGTMTFQDGAVQMTSTAGSNRYIRNVIAGNLTGKVTYEMKLKYAEPTGNFSSNRFFKISQTDLDGSALFNTGAGGGQIYMSYTNSQGAVETIYLAKSIKQVVSVWHDYKVIIDNDNRTYNLFIDGMPATSTVDGINLKIPSVFLPNVSNIRFEKQLITTGGTATESIKDFVIYKDFDTLDNAITATKDVNNKITANLKYTGLNDTAVVLILAIYNDNKLQNIVDAKVTNQAAGEKLSLSTSAIDLPTGCTFKAFSWNTLEGMMPLTNPTDTITQ